MQNNVSFAKSKHENTPNFVSIENRKKISLSGVNEVISTNENSLIGKFYNTKFYVTGKNIQITKLDIEQGVVEASGTFDSIKFGQSANFFKRLFQ